MIRGLEMTRAYKTGRKSKGLIEWDNDVSREALRWNIYENENGKITCIFLKFGYAEFDLDSDYFNPIRNS